MANVDQPLFSLEARGTLAHILTYQGNKRGYRVGRVPRPRQPYTAKQGALKLYNAFITDEWSNLTPPQQATWKEPADRHRLSPYHAYLKESLARFQRIKGPGTSWPPIDNDPVPPQTTLVANWIGSGMYGLYSIHFSGTPYLTTYFLKQAAAPQPAANQAIAISFPFIADYTLVLWTPPGPGTYYFQTSYTTTTGSSFINPLVEDLVVA